AATTAPAAAGSAALVGQLTQGFADDGYPWLGLDVKGQVGTLTGVAPDAAAKDAAFAAGSVAIKNNPEANAMIGIIVDGISVQGGEAAIGAALADLPENPNLDQCQNAFIRTLDGRNVSFETGKAIINRVSSTLLDATTGVALLCSDYNIEIGGHTDSRGSDAYNLDLSQRRASAVRAYLIERGVSGETLSAVGYGETRPIDPAQTAAAYAINRRTEFIVRPR
ncbi:MAG: OmpA family protein, partial [Pseudomonadota bacterium]